MTESPTKKSDIPPLRTDIDFSIKPRAYLVGVGLILATAWLLWFFLYRPFPVDSAIPHYSKAEDLSGNLAITGSDTLEDIMDKCSRGFKNVYPNVTIHIEAKGSATAPPALTEGKSQLAPMSRQMNEVELSAFEKKYGYKPTAYKVALDALAVYVNKKNPIRGMTLPQIDGIYSSTLKRGGPSLETWGSLGLTGDWANKAISLNGRDNLSGTHEYFREHALKNGEYKTAVHTNSSEFVVEDVASDVSAIGYSGIGWRTSDVRAVSIGETAETLVNPTYENALNGSYPLARFLYIYVNQKPGAPLDKLTGEFIKYCLSHEGQEAVVEARFFPLPAKIVTETLSGKN